MFNFYQKSEPRLLDEDLEQNELQTLEALAYEQEVEDLKSVHTNTNQEDSTNEIPLDVCINKKDSDSGISSNDNTTDNTNSLQNDIDISETESQQALPHPPSDNSLQHSPPTPCPRNRDSLRSVSSISDSKPDVVKCTRPKHLKKDPYASLRNSADIASELRKYDTESNDVQRLKRHRSSGDILESSMLEDGDRKTEDILLGRRTSSFRTPNPRDNTGIWMTQVDPHQNDIDGVWMTEVAPRDNSILDEDPGDWRLSLEHFSSKRQGSKRKAKHVSRRMRSYYKGQDELIKSFENIRFEMDDDKIDMDALRRKVGLYAKITFFTNLVLLVIKIIAVVLSGSVSLISSLVDSSVDLISGVVIWITNRLVKKTDRYQYPQGRAKLEPIAIVILSVIMAVASLHLIEETIEKIVHLASGESEPPSMEWITVGISSITVVVKLVLYLVCRKVPHHTIQALAQDHRNDVISNMAAIIFGYIGSKEMQAQINGSAPGLIFLDPTGAILICIYISISWGYTGWGQIKMLTGHTAKPEFLSKITWTSLDHHEKIKKINSVRAFHFGNNFLVEISIILPADMTVQEARDIGEPLEQKLESMSEVERAFVHIDYENKALKRNKIA